MLRRENELQDHVVKSTVVRRDVDEVRRNDADEKPLSTGDFPKEGVEGGDTDGGGNKRPGKEEDVPVRSLLDLNIQAPGELLAGLNHQGVEGMLADLFVRKVMDIPGPTPPPQDDGEREV
jgi:hypothetical protein